MLFEVQSGFRPLFHRTQQLLAELSNLSREFASIERRDLIADREARPRQ